MARRSLVALNSIPLSAAWRAVAVSVAPLTLRPSERRKEMFIAGDFSAPTGGSWAVSPMSISRHSLPSNTYCNRS